MDTQNLYFQLLMQFGCCACFGAVILAAFGGLFYFFYRQSRAQLPAPPAEDFLASAALRPWEPHALEDLACRWKGDWRNLTVMGRYQGYVRGIVQSLRNPDGAGWLAFTVDNDFRQERKASIVLKTSMQRIDLRVSGQRLNQNVQVLAWVNGVNWGTITVTHPACFYQAANGAVTAQWTPVFTPKVAWVVNVLSVADPTYYPLIVNNRPIASLADMWVRRPRDNAPKPIPPALQSVSSNLDAQDQSLLLMILGMSLYFDALRVRQTDHDW